MSKWRWLVAFVGLPLAAIAFACSSDSGGAASLDDGGVNAEGGGAGTEAGGASCGSGTQGWIDTILIDGAPSGIIPGGPMFWTGTDLVAFGGKDGVVVVGRYDLGTKKWRQVAKAGAPKLRSASVVWADGRALLWGGRDLVPRDIRSTDITASGAVLELASETWKPISQTGAPAARTGHVHAWTGSRMIAYGGITSSSTPNAMDDQGGLYDPATDTWSAMASGPKAYAGAIGVWTGSHLVVSGPGSLTLPDILKGGCYDPGTNTWSTCAAGDIREGGRAVAVNGAAIGFGGGGSSSSATANVNRWSFEDGGCSRTTIGAAQPRRSGHSMVWTGAKIILFGGGGGPQQDEGAELDPVTGTWAPLVAGGTPGARSGHVAVWAQDRMIVWGGPGKTPAGCVYKP